MSVIKEQNLKLKLASVKCHIIGSVSIEFSVNYGSLVIGMIASIIEGTTQMLNMQPESLYISRFIAGVSKSSV